MLPFVRSILIFLNYIKKNIFFLLFDNLFILKDHSAKLTLIRQSLITYIYYADRYKTKMIMKNIIKK